MSSLDISSLMQQHFTLWATEWWFKAFIKWSVDWLHWMPHRSNIYWWSVIFFSFAIDKHWLHQHLLLIAYTYQIVLWSTNPLKYSLHIYVCCCLVPGRCSSLGIYLIIGCLAGTFYFRLAWAYIAQPSYIVMIFWVLYFFIHFNILFYSFSLHFSLLHNLSWYQSFSSKPLHTVWRATQSSQRRAYTHLERTRHKLFTRFGKLSAILFKDHRKKLAEEAEHTTLERSWTKRTQKKKP